MKYFKYIVIGLIIIIFNGCTQNAVTLVLRDNIDGLKKYHENGGNISQKNRPGSSGMTPIEAAVLRSTIDMFMEDSKYEKKNYKIIKYLLENGANVKNVRHSAYNREYDLFNYSLLSANVDVVKILMDYDVTIHNFNIPSVKVNMVGDIIGKDNRTTCGYKQYICNNQKFAKKYYQKLKLKKQQVQQKQISDKKNNEVDNLLGI